MILLSSRQLLLEIIKLSSTWGTSGKGPFPLKYSFYPSDKHRHSLVARTQGEGLIFPLLVETWTICCSAI